MAYWTINDKNRPGMLLRELPSNSLAAALAAFSNLTHLTLDIRQIPIFVL